MNPVYHLWGHRFNRTNSQDVDTDMDMFIARSITLSGA
jgi:hypothetical protein